ncbi:alpha/beta hydrolase [Winogradskya humida]|uniref:Epoxide hydrolase A n=1 Tax=Winogradskya humida TaxID=113566 RepID=A0ABQ3ZTQ9_9ACTN|nr:alpha/beta hydrolase [Actinoplanes humidus]GIE21948.1 epoxide hydrolase A [Actinoplanes humidus]
MAQLAYLEDGPVGGPLIIFVHGWPGIARTWVRQLDYFAARGYHVVAPDLRGYGGSAGFDEPSAYRQEEVVGDLLELHDRLGAAPAVWVGHDWGSPTVWNIAAHHASRCRAVATLAVPFGTVELGLDALVGLVDRERYPVESHPYGQFDYMAYYERFPSQVTAVFEADPSATVRTLFRRGNPKVRSRPAPTATTTADGGWFRGADRAPDLPLDESVLTPDLFAELVDAFQRNGFAAPTAYYLNHRANADYAATGGPLTLPVLFIGADHDPVIDLTAPAILTGMRATCPDLTEVTVPAGHWLQLEAAGTVNGQLLDWLAGFPTSEPSAADKTGSTTRDG